MTSEALLACAVALPWVAALVTPLFRNQPNVRETVTLVFGGALFATNIALVGRVLAGERPELDLVAVLPGLELGFKLEPLGMLFGLVASGLWIVTTFYSIGYMRGHGEVNQTRYYSCFAIAIADAMGVAYSSNLFALFIFYEVLTLSTYPLVTHHQNE